MARGVNGTWLALGVAGAVAASSAVMGRGGSMSRSGPKRFVGEVGQHLYAIKVPGLDPDDLTQRGMSKAPQGPEAWG